jgi:transposase
MFQDEGRFGRINNPRNCWAPRGFRPDVSSQMVREYTYVFAAVCPFDGVMDSLILPFVNSQTMSIFLEKVSSRHQDDFILMFMDQAGWHKADALIIPENIKIKWLPPYSPQCNPTEHVWEEVREKWFDNFVFKSLNAVEDTLEKALKSLENDHTKIANMTGFKWIISNYLIAT